jgi:hypothetical protein
MERREQEIKERTGAAAQVAEQKEGGEGKVEEKEKEVVTVGA